MLRAATLVGIVLAATGPMQLQSNDIAPGGTIPQAFMATDCGGANHSPALAWTGAPANAKSFALIVHDADAPVPGGFYHWVVYDLPAGTGRLARDAKLASAQLGVTSNGRRGYYGPCPPPGPIHHYTFTLYALDIAHVQGAGPVDGAQLAARVAGHVLAKAVLLGTEQR
jgi:Raf kinase inhibitor-like YbhB/YbcL family protein